MGVIDFILLGEVILTDNVFLILFFSIYLFSLWRYKVFLIVRPRKYIAGIVFGDKEGKSRHWVVRSISAILVVPWIIFGGWMISNALFIFLEGTGIALGLGGSLEGLNVADEIIIFYYLLGLTIVGKIGLDVMTIVDEFMVRIDVAIGGEEE